MPKSLLNRWHGMHQAAAFAGVLILTAVLFFYNWIIGLLGVLFGAVLVYFTFAAERAFRHELNQYVMTLSHRVKRAGHEVLHELPIGVMLYSEDRTIEWHNPYVGKMVAKDSLVGEAVETFFPMLKNKKDKDSTHEISLGKEYYRVVVRAEERLLYFINHTDYTSLFKRYEEEKLALGLVLMDNLDEVTQGMDDQSRSIMLARVISEITDWANRHHVYLRRTASDRFMIVMDQKTLKELEQTKFDILDQVRDLTADYKIPLTLSIGVCTNADSLVELGQLAQTSLDIALGRGGDQAAVRAGSRLSFYGGRTNAVEKRTRVRARVISHALRDLIKESDQVIVMGHRYPDMDAIGAAIGMLKMAQLAGKEAYVALEGVNPSIHRLMEEVEEDEVLRERFIHPDQALQLANNRTLVVVVDTHKASMVPEPRILQQTNRIVVIDHHRRGEEFLNEAILVYMEPYASSTCELVTELLQYFNDRVTMDVFEATALLAGIVVDTKSFSQRTGARTFEAASFLRRSGADSALVQRLLKEDLSEFNKKAEIIKNAEILYDHIAVAAAPIGKKHSQLLIALSADTLLNMNDIDASFVVCERTDGLIGVSARSLGKLNVQVVMERLGGGGHLTNAAAQLEGDIPGVVQRLKEILEELSREEGFLE